MKILLVRFNISSLTFLLITLIQQAQLSEKVTRPRNEDPESKKARKAAVKVRQAGRRADKKATKQIFGKELRSAKVKALQEHPTGIRKL